MSTDLEKIKYTATMSKHLLLKVSAMAAEQGSNRSAVINEIVGRYFEERERTFIDMAYKRSVIERLSAERENEVDIVLQEKGKK